MGIDPDLTEGMPAEARAELLREQAAAKKARSQIAQVSDIDERFDRAIQAQPAYAPKNASELGRGKSPGLSPLDLLSRGK